MSGLLRDLLHAWRGLVQKPAFFVSALATLAIGIGANVTVFSMVNGISLRPMPFGDRTESLVTLHSIHPLVDDEFGFGDSEISYPDLIDFRGARSLSALAGHIDRNFVLSADGASAERVLGGSVTPNLFPSLGVEPMLGRQFLDEEAAAPGLESVVMLTHGLWQRRYGADPQIVGKAIIINDRARTVVGVMPPGFRFPERDELYMPLRWDESPRAIRNTNAIGVLAPGATLEQARAELSSVARRLEESHPDSNRGYGVRVNPIRESYVGDGETEISIVLMAAVGFVLLIMCANLANLMIVRGASRHREVAVRAAMGAGRGRLLWTTLSESLLLAAGGSVIGLLASRWAIDWIVASFPEELPYWLSFGIDWRVLSFTVATAVFTTLAVGLWPSLRATRPDLATDLKEGGRGLSLGRSGQRLQATLAVAQIALCFGLLVGANLMVRSFLAMQTADLGFDHRPLVTTRAYLAGDAFNDISARAAFYRRAVQALADIPGVAAAAATTGIPGDDGGNPQRIVVDGRTSEGDEIGVQTLGITDGLFEALGLPLVAGRTFTGEEVIAPQSRVALINRGLAERLWPGESPLDRRIGFRGTDNIMWLRIVGVAADIHYEEIGEDTAQSRLNVYLPYALIPSRTMGLIVRAEGAPEALLTPMRQTLQGLGPTFPIYQMMPMRELRRFTTWEDEFFGRLMAVFAAMALLLACLGIYALISYSVSRRAREIGVRLALGAMPADVIRMLLREAVQVGSAGLVIGLALAIGIGRALVGSLYGVTLETRLFATMAAVLAGAIVVATWLPARRASSVEPTIALRDE
jgi:putative ABC transport system permease protein